MYSFFFFRRTLPLPPSSLPHDESMVARNHFISPLLTPVFSTGAACRHTRYFRPANGAHTSPGFRISPHKPDVTASRLSLNSSLPLNVSSGRTLVFKPDASEQSHSGGLSGPNDKFLRHTDRRARVPDCGPALRPDMHRLPRGIVMQGKTNKHAPLEGESATTVLYCEA